MTFYVQRLGRHEEMPLVKLFKSRNIEKSTAIADGHRVEDMEHKEDDNHSGQHFGLAVASYNTVGKLPYGSADSNTGLQAAQIMSSPVISLSPDDLIVDAMRFFKNKHFRHLPVVNKEGLLQGILSDRDVLYNLSGFTNQFEKKTSLANKNTNVKALMNSSVISASAETDVRYISRLIVEQRVGSIPVVASGKLLGIITRSDVLKAVMRNFVLELWA